MFDAVNGYESLKCNLLFTLAISYINLGGLQKAEENIKIMEDMFNRNLVDEADITTLYYTKAKLLYTQGKLNEALNQVNNSIDICIENGMKPHDLFLTGNYLLKAEILNSLSKYQEAFSQAEHVYNMNKPNKKENDQIFGRIFTQMSKAVLGLKKAAEALKYAEKAKTILINDPIRPNNDLTTSTDTELAKAFVAESNALASLNKNDEAVKAYGIAENIYWNNYKENMKNVDEISIMYLNAAKASCHVPLRSFYKNFRDHQIKKFGEQYPRSIGILKLNCHNLNN